MCALCATLPAGTHLQIRLKSKVASNISKANDGVEAVLIAPLVVDGRTVATAGTSVIGVVEDAVPFSDPSTRAQLALRFTSLGAAPVTTRLLMVDNAREHVDENGRITGILPSETLAGRIDQGIGKVSQKYSGFGSFLNTVKAAVLQEPDPNIVYDAGVEITLELTNAASITVPAAPMHAPASVRPERLILTLVNSQPMRTTAGAANTPSDLTNLMLLGSAEALTRAFEDAGWVAAGKLNKLSEFQVFQAVAEAKGYNEAPVSILLLAGNKPDLVFQKQNNTFAKRHHLRIWGRGTDSQGRPVWVCAATHDIGIQFSPEQRTFIHRVDSDIDAERSKVVNDLLFTGRVSAFSLVARPDAPKHFQNATGDNLNTNGKMAVLVLDSP